MNRFVACLMIGCFCGLVSEESQSAPNTEQDFLYLEIKHSLQEKSGPALDSQRHFALGEYLFEIGQLGESAASFHLARNQTSSPILRLLSTVYLAEIGRLLNDPAYTREARTLKESLAEQRFISVFGKVSRQHWASLLKNRYEMIEHVDRLEVYRNGGLFYVLNLP